VQTDHRQRIERLRQLQRLLDKAFRIPGTGIRFGWDPIAGLIPWAGDTLTALLSCAFLLQAFRMRLPRIVQLRMLLNIAIDLAVGALPIVGDVTDLFWKSNTRNLALLELYATQPQPARLSDWLFVVGIAAGVVLALSLPFVVLYGLLHALGRSFI
jgi:hypothetical protein